MNDDAQEDYARRLAWEMLPGDDRAQYLRLAAASMKVSRQTERQIKIKPVSVPSEFYQFPR